MEFEIINTDKTYTLTDEERLSLASCIRVGIDRYIEAVEEWTIMSKETNEYGTPKFVHAVNNARYYMGEIDRLNGILVKLGYGDLPKEVP